MNKLVPKILDEEFRDVLNVLENEPNHLFITGRAGSGKSTLLQLFKKTTKKKTVVVAPTGVAALNVKGQTIHSFFRFPPKMMQPNEIRKLKNHRLYKNLEVIIIDEISMVRADVIDNIDRFLRVNRDLDIPFGGVKLICFGDLFQLPPVIASGFERQYFTSVYDSPYFFSAKIFSQGADLKMIELNKVYRQTEQYFVKLLDRIRLKCMDQEDLDLLNERNTGDYNADGLYINLCSTNATAKTLNQTKLQELDTPNVIFTADIKGHFSPNNYPTDANLVLKKGAQVMFVKNDPQKKFVNGTIGKIIEFDDAIIKVLVEENERSLVIDVEKMEWELVKYAIDKENPTKFTTEVSGTFNQYPLKLAWAMTIHKSQGKTFEKIVIDLGRGAFEYGQTYVALSRCKTLGGIVLKNKLKPSDIMIDEKVVDYYDQKLRYW